MWIDLLFQIYLVVGAAASVVFVALMVAPQRWLSLLDDDLRIELRDARILASTNPPLAAALILGMALALLLIWPYFLFSTE